MTGPHADEAALAAQASRHVAVARIPASGLSGRFEADPQERAAIAAQLDLLRLDSLDFSYRLEPVGERRFRLTGTVSAASTQRCVFSLEALPTSVSEAVSLIYWPEDDLERLEGANPDAIQIDPEGPEPYDGETIDVGQLAYEVLASSLDPHPRKAGAHVDWQDEGTPREAVQDHPFAVLKRLGAQQDD